jgi:hypothetical protein
LNTFDEIEQIEEIRKHKEQEVLMAKKELEELRKVIDRGVVCRMLRSELDPYLQAMVNTLTNKMLTSADSKTMCICKDRIFAVEGFFNHLTNNIKNCTQAVDRQEELLNYLEGENL